MVSTIIDDRVVSVRGRKEHSFTRGVLCGKVKNYDQRVYSKDRILHPMRRIGEKGFGKFERISWEEALSAIHDNFQRVIECHGPESILPYSYLGHQGLLNGMHCGDSFFNKLGASIGERTFCNATASKAFRLVAGSSGGVDPESFAQAEVIIMWGINMLSTSMHHSRFVIEAINAGATFVVIDPVRTRTARRAHIHLQPKPGTDVVLAMAIANFIINENLVDMDYVNKYTIGFDKFSERARQFSAEFASEITGVSAQEIRDLALLMSKKKAVAIRTGVALERTANGGDAVRAIAALPALTGSWRVPGGGIFQHPQGTFPINRDALANPDFVEDSRNSINLFD
ncbi:MAG: molybdopterin-dependent oxidoreductase, partial [Pseudomonadota bacterium]|nr:molybdopterin-dependent oxidoreductase [Pseudomonadota bacterium]